MNSLIFNTTASELKASVYGSNQTTDQLQVLQMDQNGNLLVSLVNDDLSFEVANTSLTVEVSNSSLTVDVSNTSLTVDVSNTSLTVEVLNTSLTVEIANASCTVLVSGNSFTYLENEGASGLSGTILDVDISQFRTASMFVENNGSATMNLSLMLSPNNRTSYFTDPHYSNIELQADSATVIVMDTFAQIATLIFTAESNITYNAYFNAQA